MRWWSLRDSRPRRRRDVAVGPVFARLERRMLLSAAARHAKADVSSTVASGADIAAGVHGFDPAQANNPDPTIPSADQPLLTPQDVKTLLERAAAASGLNSAIIAVVDRNGTILGVRIESGVSSDITDNVANKVFAIDGAVSLARTGAYFANDTANLTSRLVQEISQTTITQREVDSNPDVPDPNGDSTVYGPGYIAPVGKKGHFPPGYQFQPQVDLYDIEGTNRDTLDNANGTRFNVPTSDIPLGGNLVAPESYGVVTGMLPTAQSRGIATLPGGVPLYKTVDGKPALVGGIGVFFPGTTGYATAENSTLNTPALRDKKKPDYSDIAEYMAFVASGGSPSLGLGFQGPINGAPALPDFAQPKAMRIDLVGITLNIFGNGGLSGPGRMVAYGQKFGNGSPDDGTDQPVDPQGVLYLNGKGVPYGWLVTPHAGGDLTAADVEAIVARGIASASDTRAQIRLPFNNTTRMVFAVSDEQGDILGLYRMPDATYFSIQVAVAKARNVAYYDNPSLLQPADKIKGIPAGTSLTARTFRFITLPFFPEGIDTDPPAPGNILTDGGVTQYATTKGAPLPARAFTSLQGFADFNPNRNFQDPYNLDNQSGVVFFPGSAPLYKDETDGTTTSRVLVGGLGVSGDGVFQDDDVTATAAIAYAPPSKIRADMVKLRGVRLPMFKFNRNPHIPIGSKPIAEQPITAPPLPPGIKKV